MKKYIQPLRYTDSVIVTLQSDLSRRQKAILLGIDPRGIPYHEAQVAGMLTAPGTPVLRTPKRIAWPADPAWWECRTVAEIAQELGIAVHRARYHADMHGLATLRVKNRSRAIDYPTDPAWWAARTIREAATELRCDTVSATRYARRHEFAYIRERGARVDVTHFPVDSAWWAVRTIKQAADALHVTRFVIMRHIAIHDLPIMRSPGYIKRKHAPHPAEWYATRTIAEIAAELGMTQPGARYHVRRFHLEYKPIYNSATARRQKRARM